MSNTALGCNETRRNHDGCLAIIFQTLKLMLEEAKINLHPCFVLVGYIGNTCKESPFVGVILQIAVIVGEIQFERWIADYIVKFTQRSIIVLVERMFQCIALDNMCERMAHAIKYQVKHHHSGRLVADVLCVNRTILLANGMSQGNN